VGGRVNGRLNRSKSRSLGKIEDRIGESDQANTIKFSLNSAGDQFDCENLSDERIAGLNIIIDDGGNKLAVGRKGVLELAKRVPPA
jgi:hypothetical protein